MIQVYHGWCSCHSVEDAEFTGRYPMSNDEFMLSVVESRLAEVEFGSERHRELLEAKIALLSRLQEVL